jgi:hypothetical protein
MSKWIYCDCEEYWTCPEEFETKEQAIEAGRIELGVPFYVGMLTAPKLEVNSEGVLDGMQSWNEDKFCEDAYWPPNLTDDEQKDLTNLLTITLNNWLIANKHDPSWFVVTEVEEIIE